MLPPESSRRLVSVDGLGSVLCAHVVRPAQACTAARGLNTFVSTPAGLAHTMPDWQRSRYINASCHPRYVTTSDGSKGGNSLDAVTPGLTLGTLYSSGVGINKTKQHTP